MLGVGVGDGSRGGIGEMLVMVVWAEVGSREGSGGRGGWVR